jgi:hypothetical protein
MGRQKGHTSGAGSAKCRNVVAENDLSVFLAAFSRQQESESEYVGGMQSNSAGPILPIFGFCPCPDYLVAHIRGTDRITPQLGRDREHDWNPNNVCEVM